MSSIGNNCVQDAKQNQNICQCTVDDIFTSKVKCFWRIDSHFLHIFWNKEVKAIARYSFQEEELTCQGILLHIFKQKSSSAYSLNTDTVYRQLESLSYGLQKKNREIRRTFKKVKTSKAEKLFDVNQEFNCSLTSGLYSYLFNYSKCHYCVYVFCFLAFFFFNSVLPVNIFLYNEVNDSISLTNLI